MKLFIHPDAAIVSCMLNAHIIIGACETRNTAFNPFLSCVFCSFFYILQNAVQAKRSQEVMIQEYTPEHAGKATPTGATEGDLPGFGTEDLTPAYGAEVQSQHAVQEGDTNDNTTHVVIA